MHQGRYQPQISLPSGECKYLGRYDTAEEAATVYARKYLELHGGPPEMQQQLTVATPEAKRKRAIVDLKTVHRHPHIGRKVSPASQDRPQGVFMAKGRYKAEITLPTSGEPKYLGTYDTWTEAARAFATKHRELHGGPSEKRKRAANAGK